MADITVTVNFQGICTFINTIPLPEGVHQRVLLVNAKRGVAGGIRINPHFAFMSISTVDNGAFKPLDGVRVWLEPIGVGFPPPQLALQNLSTLVELIQPLGPPMAQIANFGISEFVSCHFDIFEGSLVSQLGAGAPTVLTVTGPAPIILNQNPFFSDEVTPLALETDTTIQIANVDLEELGLLNGMNMAKDPFGATRHFLLHYLAATTYPPAAQLPGPVGPTGPTADPPLVTGSLGCSNSTYP